MSSQRIRFNRSLFTTFVESAGAQDTISELVAEDIELILDVRSRPDGDAIPLLCEDAEIYYVRPDLPSDDLTSSGPIARAAALALRHRTCVLGDQDVGRLEVSQVIAASVGMRVIDLETQPAPIARDGWPGPH